MKSSYQFKVKSYSGREIELPQGLNKYYNVNIDYVRGIAMGIKVAMLTKGRNVRVFAYDIPSDRLSFVQE